MGLFTSSAPKVFKTSEEIKKALFRINTLDYKERPEVFKALREELDHGGVSPQEFKDIISELRREHKISEVDAKNLKSLLEE